MNLTADQLEIAELGKPRLGEFRKAQITIKESKEFQVNISLFKKISKTIKKFFNAMMSDRFCPNCHDDHFHGRLHDHSRDRCDVHCDVRRHDLYHNHRPTIPH